MCCSDGLESIEPRDCLIEIGAQTQDSLRDFQLSFVQSAYDSEPECAVADKLRKFHACAFCVSVEVEVFGISELDCHYTVAFLFGRF